MNLLYCGDENVRDGLYLSALSLARQTDQPLHLYVLTMTLQFYGKDYQPLPEELASDLEKVLKQTNSESTVQIFDVGKLFERELPQHNLNTRFTPYCMLRLYADEIDEIPDRILYLDTDVICLKDPTYFYEQDLEGLELAGVLDNYGRFLFHQNKLEFDYMNSGVLLLNMKQIRKTDLFGKAREMCMSKAMFMPDQSAINKLVSAGRLWPRQYNEQRRLDDQTVFLHFTTSFRLLPYLHLVKVKPWNEQGVHDILHYDELDPLYRQLADLKEKGEL